MQSELQEKGRRSEAAVADREKGFFARPEEERFPSRPDEKGGCTILPKTSKGLPLRILEAGRCGPAYSRERGRRGKHYFPFVPLQQSLSGGSLQETNEATKAETP